MTESRIRDFKLLVCEIFKILVYDILKILVSENPGISYPSISYTRFSKKTTTNEML